MKSSEEVKMRRISVNKISYRNVRFCCVLKNNPLPWDNTSCWVVCRLTGETTNGSAPFIHFGPQPDRESVGKKKENTSSSPTGSNHSLAGFEYIVHLKNPDDDGGRPVSWTCLWRTSISYCFGHGWFLDVCSRHQMLRPSNVKQLFDFN